jgi:hypothetical protein
MGKRRVCLPYGRAFELDINLKRNGREPNNTLLSPNYMVKLIQPSNLFPHTNPPGPQLKTPLNSWIHHRQVDFDSFTRWYESITALCSLAVLSLV